LQNSIIIYTPILGPLFFIHELILAKPEKDDLFSLRVAESNLSQFFRMHEPKGVDYWDPICNKKTEVLGPLMSCSFWTSWGATLDQRRVTPHL
jgi:hypothetical protein